MFSLTPTWPLKKCKSSKRPSKKAYSVAFSILYGRESFSFSLLTVRFFLPWKMWVSFGLVTGKRNVRGDEDERRITQLVDR